MPSAQALVLAHHTGAEDQGVWPSQGGSLLLPQPADHAGFRVILTI